MSRRGPAQWVRERYFSTLTEAIEHAKTCVAWREKTYAEAERDTVRGAWSGGNYATCEQLAINGWSEGVRKAAERSTAIVNRLVNTSGMAMNTEIVPDVVGCGYDVGAYISGVPECWMRLEPVASKRAITIGTNIGASASISTDTMIARGIAVSALALAFNAAGYPVTVEIAYQTHTERGWESTIIRVADAQSGSPLDLDRLVYAMAHPTMLRLLVRSIVGENESGRVWDYGSVMSETKPPARDYDVFLGGMHSDESYKWSNPDAWIMQEYLKQTQG